MSPKIQYAFNGPHMNTEILLNGLIYTLVIFFLCFMIFYKTKEMYELTKHKGIKYFRYAFLFFGISYLLTFIFQLFHLSVIVLDFFVIPRKMMGPFIMIPVGYMSTLALFFLIYSKMWKKINYETFLIMSTTVAFLVSVIAFFTKSPLTLLMTQLPLIITMLVLQFWPKKDSNQNRKRSNRTHTKTLYFLISSFWLINLLVIGSKRLFTFEVKLIFQIISILIFVFLYYKVSKWTK